MESEIDEFEPSSRIGIGNEGVRVKFRRLESEMEEFDTSYEAWNPEWRSLSQVWTLGIGNGGVRHKLRCLESGIEELGTSSRLGIGNGGVRDKFEAWNLK